MSTENAHPHVTPNPLAGSTCRHCGSSDIWVELRPRITARPLSTWSLAGAQLKTSAVAGSWPWAVCGGCEHASEGKP